MDIPLEEEETKPAPAEVKPLVVHDISLRALKEAKDDGELYLVDKKLLANPLGLIVMPSGPVDLQRVKKGKVHMGQDWIRVDGDECPEVPTHLYVVANKVVKSSEPE